MITLKEASEETGLSEWALKRGIYNGEYPFLRIGCGKGKFYFDIDLLNEALKNKSIENMVAQQPPKDDYVVKNGIRKLRP